jgi:hypothetical protein
MDDTEPGVDVETCLCHEPSCVRVNGRWERPEVVAALGKATREDVLWGMPKTYPKAEQDTVQRSTGSADKLAQRRDTR